MSSVGDTEVFIPSEACVITVPVNSLPSSITKKMSACPVHTDRPATFISPVELREKGTVRKSRPLTPGQFLLPVVTSNSKAFKMLQEFLHAGENSLKVSDENSRAGSAFSKRENSIILYDTQIFLIVRKAKAPDWPLEQRDSTPYECEAPPLNSPVKTNGGSDITEGRSKEGLGGAEDDGKSAEKRSGDVMEREADDDVTDRKWSKDGDGAAEDDGKCPAEVLKEGEADVMEDREENETPTKDVSTNTPSSIDKIIKLEEESGVSAPVGEDQSSLANAKDYKAGESLTRRANETRSAAETHTGSEKSSSDHLKHGDAKTETSAAKAKCCKALIFPGLQSPSLMDVNDAEDKRDVKVKTSEDSDKTKASVSEIVDVNDGGRVPNINLDGEDAVVTHASKVENLLQKFESIKRRINDCLNSQGSPLTVKKPKSDDVVVVETGADCDDLIIVESCAEVERPNRHVSGDKCHVKKTGEGAVGKDPSSSAEAKGCESDVEIVDLDVDDGQVLRESPNGDANRDVANSKSCTEAKSGASPSLSGKCCESDVEIVDLNDDDDVIVNDREIANVQRLDETKSDVAAAGQIGEVNGSSAKRSKRDEDDSNFSSERKRFKRDVDPDSRSKNSNCDVEIIEIEDDDENKVENREVGRNGGNAEDSSENASSRKRDVEISELHGPGDGAERQTSSKQIESRKRRVSDSDRADSGARAQIIETEDSSDEHVNSANVTNPDETFTKTESSVRPDRRDDLINNEDSSEVHTREADSLCTKSGVEIEIVHDSDRVHESEQEPNENDSKPTNSKNGVNETTIQTLAAEGPISEVQGSDQRESGPESRALDPGPDVQFAEEESEATNQRARGEGVLPRPSSPRANQEFDYVELSREENISLMKAQIRLMEEKLRLMEMNL